MAKRNLIIYGAGDLGREIMYASLEQNPKVEHSFHIVAFIEDDPEKTGNKLEGIDIISFNEFFGNFETADHWFISGISKPDKRRESIFKLKKKIKSARFATVIHRSAVIMQSVMIEDGVYIGGNATIGIGSEIKEHSVVNFNCSIGHDTLIDRYTVLSPGCIISGKTSIGKISFLGSGAITYPKVNIGSNCVISAGAIIARNVKDNSRVIEKPNTMILPNVSN